MAFLVEHPVYGISRDAGRVLFDMGLCAKAVGDISAQVIGIVGCVRDDVLNTLKTFDQAARLGAIAPVAGRDRAPDRQAQSIDGRMDFGCQAASGTANTGSFKPPF